MIDDAELDTSPAVLFGKGAVETLEFDGHRLLIEPEPEPLDHLAICDAGVWSKQDETKAGIETSSNSETQSTET